MREAVPSAVVSRVLRECRAVKGLEVRKQHYSNLESFLSGRKLKQNLAMSRWTPWENQPEGTLVQNFANYSAPMRDLLGVVIYAKSM